MQAKMERFVTTFMKKQQFAVGVKIFPFDNRVVSLHLVVIRIEYVNEGERETEDDEPAEAQKQAGKKDKAAPETQTGAPEKINLFKKKKGEGDNP